MPTITLTGLSWLFTLGVLVHNAEEAIFLPAWSSQAGRWHPKVGPLEFRFAVTVLSALLIALAIAANLSGEGAVSAYLFAGYTFAMVANVFLPHALATITLRRYMPGTATAFLFNLPLGSLFLYRAVYDGFVRWSTVVWVAPLTALAMVASIPMLFALGRRLAHPTKQASL